MNTDRPAGLSGHDADAPDGDDDAVPLLTEEVELPAGHHGPGALDDLDWVDLADRLRQSVMAELGDSVTRLLSARMAESVRLAIGPALSQASASLRADLELRVSEAVDRAVSAEIQRLRKPLSPPPLP
ncbi:MAG: hypothetical protein ACO26U_07350 [Burkholderiaceae bacterium]